MLDKIFTLYPNRGMSSLDELSDNLFSCGETPLWFPPQVDISRIPVCKSCIFRFTAPVAGPGVVLRPNSQKQGFDIDENPQTSITFNGIRHSYRDCVVTVPGSHKLPGKDTPADAELQIFFKSDTAPSVVRVVCITIQVSSEAGNEYFSDLGKQIPSRKKTLASLLTKDDQWFMYSGNSFENRTKETPKTDIKCKSNLYKTTYLVKTTPVFINNKDFFTLAFPAAMLESKKQHLGPPIPFTAVSLERIYSFVTIIPSTELESPDAPKRVKKAEVVTTKQLKCRRLDVANDIKDGKIYIGGEKRPGDTTLQQELDDAANLAKAWEETGTRIQPGDFENILGGVLATVLALLILGILAFFTLKFTYKDYKSTIDTLYDKSKNPATGILSSTGSFFKGIGEKLSIC